MSRHDHFRQWLVSQSPHSGTPAPPSARAKYFLPEYRLPDPAPSPPQSLLSPYQAVWTAPQGMTSPIFVAQSLPTTPSVTPPPLPNTGVNLPLVPRPRAIAPEPRSQAFSQAFYTASLPDPHPRPLRRSVQPSPPPQPVPVKRPSSRVVKGYSYGLVIIVWLGMLGIGGYALSRLMDPLFTASSTRPTTQATSPNASSEVDMAQSPMTTAPPATAPAPPSLFDYADASPRPSASPIWALVAIIAASALGSRVTAQRSSSRRDR